MRDKIEFAFCVSRESFESVSIHDILERFEINLRKGNSAKKFAGESIQARTGGCV